MASSGVSSMESIIIIPHQLPQFISGVPDDYKCSLCHNILRIPVATECGHRFCKACMDNYRSGYNNSQSVPCPVGETDCSTMTHIYPDFSVKREIQLLNVYCSNKDNGCNEEMPWGQLTRHLLECKYNLVKCSFSGCNEKLSVEMLARHKGLCDYRREPCPNCGEIMPLRELSSHMDSTCTRALMTCGYECGEQVVRESMETHKAVCPKAPKQCTFHGVGCGFVGISSELEQHLAQESVHHLTMVSQTSAQNIKDIQQLKTVVATKHLDATHESNKERYVDSGLPDRVDQLEQMLDRLGKENNKLQHNSDDQQLQIQKLLPLREELEEQKSVNNSLIRANSDLKNEVQKLRHDLDNVRIECKNIIRDSMRKIDNHLANPMEHVSDGILIWKISGYSKLKEDAVIGSKTYIYSTPFYTDRIGYKMCARLYPNGDGMGRGTHASLFFALMKGEYDSILPWPFNKKIMFTLMDQSDQTKPHRDGFISDPKSTSFKQPKCEMNVATGCPLFIRQIELENPRYLKNDEIFIKIEVLDL